MDKHVVLSWFHVLVAVPLLLWVGWQGNATSSVMFTVLLVLGVFITGFHGWRAIMRGFPAVNVFHALLVGPLLLWIGWQHGKADRLWYQLMLMLGVGALVMHGSYLIQGGH